MSQYRVNFARKSGLQAMDAVFESVCVKMII